MMFCFCARPRADVNASVYILHNLHHTSRIEIYIQHTAGLQYYNIMLILSEHFLTVYSFHFWTWEWCHDDSEASFVIIVYFYLSMYIKTLAYKNFLLKMQKRTLRPHKYAVKIYCFLDVEWGRWVRGMVGLQGHADQK